LLFFRRRHQARRPPLAKIRPGSPAPTTGPGTAVIVAENVELPEAVKTTVPPAVAKARPGLMKGGPEVGPIEAFRV